MAQTSNGLPIIARSLADRVDACFPAVASDPGATGAAGGRVRTRSAGRIVVLDVEGLLTDVAPGLDRAIGLALAELPRGVACDLSAVHGGDTAWALRELAAAGRHVRDWPGIPVAVACPDPQLRAALSGQPLGGHLLVTDSIRHALSAVLGTAAPLAASVRLAPHPTAPRASRDFVNRTLLQWGLGHVIATACLVTSELVTNAMVHAGTEIHLALAVSPGSVRVTVRDHSDGLPLQRRPARLSLDGRGLGIVAALSCAWGALPTADVGKVVWAVLDASASPGEQQDAG